MHGSLKLLLGSKGHEWREGEARLGSPVSLERVGAGRKKPEPSHFASRPRWAQGAIAAARALQLWIGAAHAGGEAGPLGL